MADEFEDDPDEPQDQPEMRYAAVQDALGRWSVIDTVSSIPAATNGRDLVGLDRDDARDIAAFLNKSGERHPLL